MADSKKNDKLTPLMLLLTISFFLKGLLLYFHGSDTINTDGVIYVSAAQAIESGNWGLAMKIYPMPAYPALLALVHQIVPDWTLAGRVLSCVMLTLAIIPVYFLTLRLFYARTALFTGFAAALWPTGTNLAMDIYRDPCFLALGILSLYLFVEGVNEKNVQKASLSFIAAWLSLIFRVEGILLPVSQLSYLTYRWLYSRLKGGSHDCARLLMCGLSISLAAVAALFAAAHAGQVEINRIHEYVQLLDKITKGELFSNLKNIHKQLKLMEQYSPFPNGSFNFAEIARHYSYFIYFMGVTHAFLKAFFLPFAVIGLYGAKTGTRARSGFLIFLASIFLIMGYFFLLERDFLEERFLLLPAFSLLPWAGAGLALGIEKGVLVNKRHPWFLISISVILLAFSANIKAFSEPQDTLVKDAGRWLSANCPSQKIVTNDIRIVYEAGLNLFLPGAKAAYWDRPVQPWRDLESFAARENADLVALVINTKKITVRPGFKSYSFLKEFKDRRRAIIFFIKDKKGK